MKTPTHEKKKKWKEEKVDEEKKNGGCVRNSRLRNTSQHQLRGRHIYYVFSPIGLKRMYSIYI